MGWLEARVQEIEGRELKLTALARQLRNAPNWPKAVHLEASSLGTYLKKLDQEKDLRFLEKHPALRAFLAGYLKFSPEEFEEQLTAVKTPRERQLPPFELWDAGTRPLDLRQEPLPPAFPPEVLEPRAWPVLWQAPSGSARTLVGEWLAAQLDVVFIKAENWAEAEQRLPSGKGKVFISLKSPSGMPGVTELPSRLSICVAVDGVTEHHPAQQSLFGEPIRKQEEPKPEQTWPLVRAPPVEQWLEALVVWIWERRDTEVEFNPQACLQWMQTQLLPWDLIDGFGSAVGFVGLYATHRNLLPDEKGPLRADSLLRLARSFIRTRLKHVRNERRVPKLEALWAYLERLAQGMLMHGTQSWEQARSIEEWQELVPDSLAPEALEWLSQPAVRQKLKVEERTLKKVAEEHSPEAFLMVRALQNLRLLREQQPGQYVPRPRWVFAMLHQQAALALLQGPVAAWGQALLHPQSAYIIIFQLLARCRAGDFTPIQRLLAQPEPSSPKWVASLEASFVALGWTRLEDSHVPPALATEVFEAQQRLMVEHHQIPLPRLGYGYEAWHPMLKPGAWLLAAHVLSEQRSPPPGTDHPLLNPWLGGGEPRTRDQVLTLIRDVAFDDAIDRGTRLCVFKLYGRMLGSVGPFIHLNDLAHDLQMPALLSESARNGTLTWSYFKGYRRYRELFMPLMREYLEQQGVSWEVFARALWRAWLDSGEGLGAQRGAKVADWVLAWYAFVPPEAILNERLKHVLENNELPFEHFKEEQWEAFLTYWKRENHQMSFHESVPWRRMPARFIRRAIAEDVIHPHQGEVLRTIWEVDATAVRQELGRLIEQGRWKAALTLAWSAPSGETQAITDIVQEGLRHPGVPRQDVIHWLHDRIRKRTQSWEHVWSLLHELPEPLP